MIIAFDGASTDLSVGLAGADGTLIAEDGWSAAHRQSAELLPRLLAMLGASGHSLHDVTAIGVGLGPGSFTGLRVAVALAKGLAFGLDLPLYGVPSLQAWLMADPDALAAVARAGARDAYVLRPGDAAVAIVDRDDLGSAEQVVAPADIAEAFGIIGSRPPRAAVGIASLVAARRASDDPGDDLKALEPNYLRAPRGVATESREPVRWL
ncbi:MAG: tRNA (adenosine(37)-N6)-threonylcarbamoyltransferase complex dimerization subunit type 1 TsaB [Candidatus Limnocylindria bacterium]